MSSMNQVFLMGNLTRDPESRAIPNGGTVANMGIAVSDNYKDRDGNLVERACFADVVAWGKTAENCIQYLKKGSPILVEGKLQLDQWKTENGENRSKLRVKAMRVQFLSRGQAKRSDEADAIPETDPDAMPF